MDKKQFEYGIQKYGTPMYVYDVDELSDMVNIFRKITENRAGLCFAMKANPFLTRQMAALTDRIEVCSMGEFMICKELEIPPDKILISGVLKKREDLAEILETYGNLCTYTVESENQLRQIREWSEKNSKRVNLYLRLTSGNQFGMDEKTVRQIIERRGKLPFIKIQGIHFFSGTQKRKLSRHKEELNFLDSFLRDIEETCDYQIEELEYGPGIAVNYFQGTDNSPAADLQQLVEYMTDMRWKGSVMLEMGRAFTAFCGYYLTAVRDIKNNGDINYCIVDGGIHQLNYDGQIRGMYRPYVRMLPEAGEEKTEKWTVCGSLCTVNDVLSKDILLAGPKAGSVLIFERTGAYCAAEGMALFLSHELPAVALYSKSMGWKILREKEETFRWNMERGE